ncbi:nuclear transport factor 2 family protein [Mycolicibacterium llatzerense]|uniref:nuclear transport factor 2 family protein n=1 Tax=Mycolicibacterium llatzerense TaxID=280871 RepID=UPI0021B55F0A|nr:nuclear transport factor 2 family protein [Mycolicibacterium llatzerense]MCT7365438.1 hypothetical protein [Mycolicibacterium llatzerense]
MSTPDTTVEVAERLYSAFTSHDRAGLAALLHPDFTGRVSEGMPFGLGGAVHSPEQMLRDVWGGASAHWETAPYPDEFVAAGANRVMVLGYYRGRGRTTGRRYTAAFVHDITVRDGKIASLTQITDTKAWHDALAAG